ncbi:MAG: Translation initiation factor IF-2 [bacterium ADurb.Bin212]|nr:MAG: Translation initiation factor IF-2 [bacterium ADurb.Bin212]
MKRSYKKNKSSFSFSKPKDVSKIADSVSIPPVITVKDLSDKTNVPAVKIISELMKNGVLAAINESIDFDTAAIVCDDLGVKCEPLSETEEVVTEQNSSEVNKKNLVARPPVVTIMGHVDHGKTTLLDTIRKAHVVDSESGGITQHISAYQVSLPDPDNKNEKRLITFIDTPGHAAFSALRSHGTLITDIVVLIVAANDGIMPQTIEVIEQCKTNKVPIIVAINKIDLPDADVMKIKKQLSDNGLMPEEWGGDTLVSEISAKSGQGVDDLLNAILVKSEMMDLKADPKQTAFGVVIESHMHKGAGPLALVLIENGTLRKGDAIQIGQTWGKVRILEDYNKMPIDEAGPSCPARIAGLRDIPTFGDHLISYPNEKEAKIASLKYNQNTILKIATAKKLNESDQEAETENKISELNIIIKADVKGSLEAVKKLVSEIDTLELKLKVVGDGIGSVSESDVTLAKATKSYIYAFRVPVLISSEKVAEKEGVSIKKFQVIYEMIDDIKRELTNILPTIYSDEILAKGKVLAMFRNDKKAMVVGAILSEGRAKPAESVRFMAEDGSIVQSSIVSLRREKNQTDEINSGVEFGMSLDPGTAVKEGNTFEVFKKVKIDRKIE